MRYLTILLSLVLLNTPAVFAEAPGRHPDNVKKNIEFVRHGDHENLISEVEYTKVLNVDFNSIVNVLSDLNGAADLFPNVEESQLVPSGSDDINRKIKATYKIMGLGHSYEYLEKINIHHEPEREFVVESIMIKSLDQQINKYRGVWQIIKLPNSADGESRTAVSLYSYFNYSKPFFLQNIILETFTDEEVARMFDCVEKAASVQCSSSISPFPF